jgi:hypothetical protein
MSVEIFVKERDAFLLGITIKADTEQELSEAIERYLSDWPREGYGTSFLRRYMEGGTKVPRKYVAEGSRAKNCD